MFKNALVAILALFTLGLPAAAQEPTRQERAATLVSARSWGESEVSEYIRLVSTEEGRSVLLPVTSSGAECERQVAALDSFRLRLQAYPEMGETMTEGRFAAMRVQAVQLGACNGVVAQIDRLIVVRRTLAATSTAIAVEPTNPSPAQILLADLSWNSSQVDQYLNLFGTREGRAVLMPATSRRIECERQVAALDSLRLMLQSQPSIGENLTEYRLAGMREHAVELGACDGVVAQIDRITTVRRTLAATSTAIAVDPTNLSRAEALISDASWSESDVTEYIYLVTTRTGRAVLLPATTQGDECERQVAALDNFRLRLQAHPQIIESLTEERLTEMRADALGVGACRGVVAQIDRLSVVRRTLAETSTGTAVAPAPVSDTPEMPAEEIEDGSIVDEEVDVLRPGQSLFDVELRADCSVYYRRALVQGRTEFEYGQDGTCELLPRVDRSPSGRWIAVHTPLDNYGFGQVAIIDAVAERVAVPPREIVREGRLYPLNVWSPDENRLLMTELSFLGPPINDAYQLTVMVPCEFDIAAVALSCIDRDRFASTLQAAALRASPLARCLPQRSCYLVMDISQPRFEAGELAYTGTVQLKTLEAGASRASGPSISETFVPGEDIVWFQFSGRGPRSTAQDITLRVLDPLVEPNIARVQPEAPPPATGSDLRLQPVQVACVRPGRRGGPITVTPGGQIMLGETPLFRGLFRGSNLTADYAFLVRPANSAYRLVLGSEGDWGPVEAAIVDGASMRVVHPGILGPGRVRGVAPAQNVVQFPGQCDSDSPYEPISWRSFGGGRYVAGISTASEGEGALVIIDLQTGLWAQWEPSPATYPAPRRRLPAGETSADWMLFHAEPGRSQITAIDSQTGQITLSATFSFDCNMWQGARDGSNADLCLIGGIPDSNNEANNSPELLKSYNIRLQLGR